MASIPLLSSIGATEAGDLETIYPVNMEPVAVDSNISSGYLRTAMGAILLATAPGTRDRGAINWNGVLYRVCGPNLISVDLTGNIVTIGNVGDDGNPVRLDYGFGRLAIASNRNLFYYDGATLSQVTDPDLGTVVDMVWKDGYYVTTDGTSIVVTDLSDPFNVNPNKYGSAEADPDPVVALGRLRGELLAFGSNTIQTYGDVGGNLFPFQANTGATIPIGVVGTFAVTPFIQSYAFVGGARNQAIGVWIMGQGSASKVSTRAIDDLLALEPNKQGIQIEARVSRDENRLYIHLSDRTLVYLAGASGIANKSVWYVCRSGVAMDQPYRLRNAVWAYDKLICGDLATGQIGVVSENLDGGEGRAFFSWSFDGETWSIEKALTLGKKGDRYRRLQWRPHLYMSANYASLRFRGTNGQTQFGEAVGWQLSCGLIYNKTNGAQIHDVELVGLLGRNGLSFAACECRIEGLGA